METQNFDRYKKLNEWLKEKFGERTLKICIDGGFTCPNRDGTIGLGGCIFCSVFRDAFKKHLPTSRKLL